MRLLNPVFLMRLPTRAYGYLRRKTLARVRRYRWSRRHPSDHRAMGDCRVAVANARLLWKGLDEPETWPLARQRWPQLHEATTRCAQNVSDGIFDYLGMGPTRVTDEQGNYRWNIDFRCGAEFPLQSLYLDIGRSLNKPGADIKIPWELSRFQSVFPGYFSGLDGYGEMFFAQWRDWMESNPLGRGLNWSCAMEVALRAMSWSFALAAWGGEWPQDRVDQLSASLLDHGRFIRDNLEWYPAARTNHYYANLVGLAVLGLLFRERPEGRRWANFARKQLQAETLQQFAPDGFNRETSTVYHRFMCELGVVGLLACREAGEEWSPRAQDRLAEAFRALHLLGGKAGVVPIFSDNDSGRVFPIVERRDTDAGQLLRMGSLALPGHGLPQGEPSPEAVLLFGAEGLSEASGGSSSTQAGGSLPDSGLFILGDTEDRMIIRCGPLTYRPVGGHLHLDQLSFCLMVKGKPIIVDPGQFCYTAWPEVSLAYRLSRSHNTMTVNGLEQGKPVLSPQKYAFRRVEGIDVRCVQFEASSEESFLIGEHNGFADGCGPLIHRRTVRHSRSCREWEICDEVVGREDVSQAEWRFHLHPEVSVRQEADSVILESGVVRVCLRFERKDLLLSCEPYDYSPGYGRRTEATVLRFQADSPGRVKKRFTLSTGSDAEVHFHRALRSQVHAPNGADR
ncbi:MAG: alginate lyase family protein [Phycisphaerae bacterium]